MRLIDIDAFFEKHKFDFNCLSKDDMYWKEQLENAPIIEIKEEVELDD